MKLYFFIRPIVRFGLKLYFKNIFVSGLNKIQSNKSLIIASNHPSAFFEPILMACLHKRTFFFLTRGDIFQKSFFNSLLSKLNMIPIFRFRDGHENMKKNQEVFNLCNKLLTNKEAIMIFPEGHLSSGIGLDKLQKGTARMAFNALQNDISIDLWIVPVTYYYSDAINYRGDAFLECSKPIHVNDYFKDYIEHDALTINVLTQDLERVLDEKVIKIEHNQYKTMLQSILKMYRNEFEINRNKSIIENRSIYQNSRLICNNFIGLDDHKKDYLLEKFNKLENLASKSDYNILFPVSQISTAKYYFALITGIIPYMIGYINLFPINIAKAFTEKKVIDPAFVGPVKFGTSLFFWIIYYCILLILALIINNVILYFYVILLPFITYYAIYYYDFIKFERNSRKSNPEINKLRNEFMAEIDELIR